MISDQERIKRLHPEGALYKSKPSRINSTWLSDLYTRGASGRINENGRPQDPGIVQRYINADQIQKERLLHELFTTYYNLSVRVAQRRGLDFDVAQEVAQDAISRGVKAINQQQFDSTKGRFTAYLYAIIRNLTIDNHRKNNGRRDVETEWSQQSSEVQQIQPGDNDGIGLYDALSQIPSEQAKIIILEGDGYTHSEIAEILEIPLGTVNTRAWSGKKKLSAILNRPLRKTRKNKR